jgi:hypothetical protein
MHLKSIDKWIESQDAKYIFPSSPCATAQRPDILNQPLQTDRKMAIDPVKGPIVNPTRHRENTSKADKRIRVAT